MPILRVFTQTFNKPEQKVSSIFVDSKWQMIVERYNLPQYIQAGTREEQYIYTSKFVHWKSFDWTSQLYFNDSLTDEVHTQDPYSHHGFPDTRNSQDGIYTGSSLDGLVQANSGTRLMLNLNKDKQGSFLGIFDVLLDSGQQQPAQ